MHPQLAADVLTAARTQHPAFIDLLGDIGLPLVNQIDDLRREGAVIVGLGASLQYFWSHNQWDDANCVLRHMMQNQPQFWSSFTNQYTPNFLFNAAAAAGSPRAISDLIDACWIANKPDHNPHYLFDVVGGLAPVLVAQPIHPQSEECLDAWWDKATSGQRRNLITRLVRVMSENAIAINMKSKPSPMWSAGRLIERCLASDLTVDDLSRPLHTLITTEIQGGIQNGARFIDEIAEKVGWSDMLLVNPACLDRVAARSWRQVLTEGTDDKNLNDHSWWFSEFGAMGSAVSSASSFLQYTIRLVEYCAQQGKPLDTLEQWKGLQPLVEMCRPQLSEHPEFLAICDRVLLQKNVDSASAPSSPRKVM